MYIYVSYMYIIVLYIYVICTTGMTTVFRHITTGMHIQVYTQYLIAVATPSYSPSGIILDDGKSWGKASPARPHEPCLVLLVSNGQSQGIPSAQTGPASVTGRSGSSYHISEPKISSTRDPKENKRPDNISMKLQHYLQTMPSNSRATLAAINKA